MTESYKDYPLSIAEIKSERSDLSVDWTARDALIDMLRQVDNGLKITTMAICYVEEVEGGSQSTSSKIVTSRLYSRNELLGLLARVSYLIQCGDTE